jgi:hypothetical protein
MTKIIPKGWKCTKRKNWYYKTVLVIDKISCKHTCKIYEPVRMNKNKSVIRPKQWEYE